MLTAFASGGIGSVSSSNKTSNISSLAAQVKMGRLDQAGVNSIARRDKWGTNEWNSYINSLASESNKGFRHPVAAQRFATIRGQANIAMRNMLGLNPRISRGRSAT